MLRATIKTVLCLTCIVAVLFTAAGCKTGRNGDTNGSTTPTTQTEQTGTQPSESTQTKTQAYSGLKSISETERTTVELEYKPVEYEALVEEYAVEKDLSNIENLHQFGEFTQAQTGLLSKNGFAVTPSKDEQLFYIYERNEYLKLPSFITADSILQVYHIFFDYSLRTLEAQKLLGALEKLTDSMLSKSIHMYNTIQNPQVKSEALVNIAYFGVAQLALQREIPTDMPLKAKELAQKEFALVTDAGGFMDSHLFPFKLDYSQYVPRGHYTRSEDLKRYFMALMWYGQVPFNVYKDDSGRELDKKQITKALLMTYALFLENGDDPDHILWEQIYAPTVFYVGKADDLTVYDYLKLLFDVYGDNPRLDMLMDSEYETKLEAAVEKLPEPSIKHKYVDINIPAGKQFRFMGQRYIPDSEILQEVVEPIKRPIPSGLDVMGVLGSERAKDILVNRYRVPEQWEGYLDAFNSMKNKFDTVSEQTWRSNLYYGWLWVLKSQLSPYGEGYPAFMRNEAWTDKCLNTALASWTELRHDTILYGKQSGAECGGDEPPEVIRSYVEPNIELYNRLLWLTRYSRENLAARQILPEELQSKMQRFEDLLAFLINCSIKQLRNEELSVQEYSSLLTYGATLEYLTCSLADDNLRWFEITSETDKNMAVIADVHTAGNSYLEEAAGQAYEIFVVVPVGGKLYLTRGAVFSYYEFISKKRLTDEEWQQMLREGKQPGRPEWTKSFETEEKEEIPVPKEPYNSGC